MPEPKPPKKLTKKQRMDAEIDRQISSGTAGLEWKNQQQSQQPKRDPADYQRVERGRTESDRQLSRAQAHARVVERNKRIGEPDPAHGSDPNIFVAGMDQYEARRAKTRANLDRTYAAAEEYKTRVAGKQAVENRDFQERYGHEPANPFKNTSHPADSSTNQHAASSSVHHEAPKTTHVQPKPPSRGSIQTGAKGGKYYISPSGEKVYLK